MSLPNKLTSLSTHTLSLLLERQRLQTLPAFTSSSTTPRSLHVIQIAKNLEQLYHDIRELEAEEGPSEAVELSKNQYERLRAMFGKDADLQGTPRHVAFSL